jgi:hypothetical protein
VSFWIVMIVRADASRSLFQETPVPDPGYSFEPTQFYQVERVTTGGIGVNYWVNSRFESFLSIIALQLNKIPCKQAILAT